MKQASFKFTSPNKAVFKFDPKNYQGADPKAGWASVVLADPDKYPGLMQQLAIRALHRAGKPHLEQNCPLCEPSRLENVA